MSIRPLRLLGRALGIVLAIGLLLAAAGLWWVGQTTSFLRWSLQQASAATDGALQADGVRGTLFGGFRIASLRWSDAQRDVRLRDLSLRWRPERLVQGELRLARVEIAEASVKLAPGGTAQPPSLPSSLRLPLAVRIEALGIGRLDLDAAEAPPIALERVSLAGQYRDGAYRIVRLGAHSPQWGEAALQGVLGDRPPYALEATGEFAPRSEHVATLPRVRVLADGTVESFSVAAQAIAATSRAASGEVPARPVWIGLDTQVHPLAPTRSGKLEPIAITFDSVEPAQFGFAEAPIVRLAGSATVRIGDDDVRGELQVENALPGPVDRNAVPLRALQTAFAWSGRRLALESLRASLPSGASVVGDVEVDFGSSVEFFDRRVPAMSARLDLGQFDLSEIASRWHPTRLSGTVQAQRDTLAVDLADETRESTALAARVRLDGAGLRVDSARLRTAAGELQASGTAALAAPYAIDLQGRFQALDPAGAVALVEAATGRAPALGAPWLDRLHGRLSGRWSAKGRAWPDPRLRTALVVRDGTLDGERLRVDWAGEVVATQEGGTIASMRIADAALDLAFGDLALKASGSLGRRDDRMRFAARAAALQRFDARLSGSVRAEGELSGGWSGDAHLGVAARLAGASLGWSDRVRAGALSARIEWPELPAGRIALDLDARALQWADRRLDRLELRVDGDAAAHALRWQASGPDVSARASAHGALDVATPSDWRWEGVVETLAVDAPLPARLESPAPLVVDAHGVSFGPASAEIDGARVQLAALTLREGTIDTRGEATRLPVGRWAERLRPRSAKPGADAELAALLLDAQWDLRGAAATALSGRLALQVQTGVVADGRGYAQLVLDQGRLDGDVDLRIPTLAFANRIIGPEWQVSGRLRFAGAVGGTIEAPQLRGELQGDELALQQRTLGWRFTGGTLRARFDGDRLDVQQLRLESGTGVVAMRGDLLLEGMQGRFELRADRLPVPLGPGERVVVSGDSLVTSRGAALEWTGTIRADEGLIELRGGDAPRLPEDVVLLGGEDTRARGDEAASGQAGAGRDAPREDGLRVAADLGLDLGEKLRVRGSGVDVLLAGTIRLRGALPSKPLAYGTVNVRKGTYTAYGKQLEITRGKVVFDGAIDNPVLDIVAMRLNQPVQAGVALTGTVLSPRIRLVSKPEVPDSQKLSWLVLGTGLDDARSGAQTAALQAAAASLFGGSEGGVSGGMAHALGLDVLTVREANAGGVFDPDFGATFPGQAPAGGVPEASAAQNVVAIGKRLSSRVLVTYEQGLRGVWSLLRIQYDITNRLSVRAQAGTDTALDLLYFYSFD